MTNANNVNNVVQFAPRRPPAKAPPLQVAGFYLDPETGDIALHLRDPDGNITVMQYDLRDWSGPKSFSLSVFVEFWQGWMG